MAESFAEIRSQALRQAEMKFNQLDLNGDGTVDANELRQLAAAAGVDMDDTPEARAMRERMSAEFFGTFDSNGDGKVSKEEWLSYFGDLFDRTYNEKLQQLQSN